MQIVFLFIGLVVGFCLAWLLLKLRMAESSNTAIQNHPVMNELRIAKEKLQTEVQIERTSREEAIIALAGAQANLISMGQKLREQEEGVQKVREDFAKEFENLANRIFDDKSKKVTEQNRTQLDLVLSPLKEKLKDFENKVEKVYSEENRERINLKAEIKLLSELNKQLSSEANNLATALKGDNKTQGNWGELILEKILERSGLVDGIEFKTQETTTNVNDERIRPDVVIFLPEGKHLIIDSKVSLIAYNSMISANSDEERGRYVKAHCESVRSHVKQLGDKNYHTARGYNTPDFILLFMPIETAFSTALQADSELYNLAWERKIVIVSPTTLLATLRTVSSLWMQEKRNKNADIIAQEAGKLYDKFQGFTEDLIKLGHDLKKSQENYSEAMKKLSEGTGNLVGRVEKIKELGGKTNKQINQKLIDRSIGDD